MNVKDFIGERVEYDPEGAIIWGVKEDGELKHVLDVRGFGSIQNLFKNKKGQINMGAAYRFQDQIGNFIVSAINEKLEKDVR